MVGAVGELLRFERQRLAVALRLAVFADALAVEEVGRCKPAPGLVAQHLDGTSRGGFPDRGGLLDAAWGLAVDDPVVVVAAAVAQLFVLRSDALADGVRLTEVERRTLYRGNLAVGISTESTGVVWLALIVITLSSTVPLPSPLRLKNGWFDMFTTVGLSVVAL